MSILHDNNVKIKITESVCAFVAICMTFIRLWKRRGRYWWDDAWVFISVVCLFAQIASAFMHVDDTSSLSRTGRIAAYYLIATTFYAVIWSARLSILFSIIRIDPDIRSQRRLYYIAFLFMAAILFFFAQLFWVCEPQGDVWKNLPSPQCHLGKQVAICQLVSDVIADLLLIFLPIRLIRGMSDNRLKRRLYFIFSTSIVTTIVSLVHAAYILTDGTVSVLLSAIVEDCMSLTVANVPVVATAVLRSFSSNPTPMSDEDEETREGTHWTSFRFRSRFPGAQSTFGLSRKAGVTSHWGSTTTRGGAGATHVQLQTQTQSQALTVPESSADARSKHTINLGSFASDSDYRHESKPATATVDISMGPLQSLDDSERQVHGPATSAVRH